MKTLYLVAATILGIAACLTSSAEPAEPAANAGDSATDGKPTVFVKEQDVPEVPEAPITEHIVTEDTVICWEEQGIGSRIVKRVCRTAGEIVEERAAVPDTFRKLRAWRESGLRGPE